LIFSGIRYAHLFKALAASGEGQQQRSRKRAFGASG
jgi:hypothetical protein